MSPHHGTGMVLAEVAVARKPDWTPPAANRGQLVQLFFNVNLIKSHRGLKIIAKEYDIDLDALESGQYVGFLNRARNRIKLFTAGNMYAYLVLPDLRGNITIQTVAMIPKAFQSMSTMQWAPVLEQALESPVPLTGYERQRQEWLTAGSAPRPDARKE